MPKRSSYHKCKLNEFCNNFWLTFIDVFQVPFSLTNSSFGKLLSSCAIKGRNTKPLMPIPCIIHEKALAMYILSVRERNSQSDWALGTKPIGLKYHIFAGGPVGRWYTQHTSTCTFRVLKCNFDNKINTTHPGLKP